MGARFQVWEQRGRKEILNSRSGKTAVVFRVLIPCLLFIFFSEQSVQNSSYQQPAELMISLHVLTIQSTSDIKEIQITRFKKLF
jgi:hypothetical protein